MRNFSAGWTPARRRRQRELIQRWRPWLKSTGPRTDAGKARSSRNADRGGLWLSVRRLNKKVNAIIRALRAAGFYDRG